MWIRIHILLLLLVGVLLVQPVRSQNLPDNMVSADCATDAVEQPWDAQVLHSVNDIHCYFVPIVGDIDGDTNLDMVYIDYQTQVNNSRIIAITYSQTAGLQPKWQATHGDRSGQTSMTLFDFNQDNIMEIVYRDENNLRIINGSGKSHKTGNDTIPFYNLYTKSMSAGTWKEYPVVADVNGDGAAEIVVCGKVGSGLG